MNIVPKILASEGKVFTITTLSYEVWVGVAGGSGSLVFLTELILIGVVDI